MTELLEKVKSSNIASIGFNKDIKTLYVRFIGGGLYSYRPFDSMQFGKFKKAKSKGKWFHKHVLNNKKFTVVKISD